MKAAQRLRIRNGRASNRVAEHPAFRRSAGIAACHASPPQLAPAAHTAARCRRCQSFERLPPPAWSPQRARSARCIPGTGYGSLRGKADGAWVTPWGGSHTQRTLAARAKMRRRRQRVRELAATPGILSGLLLPSACQPQDVWQLLSCLSVLRPCGQALAGTPAGWERRGACVTEGLVWQRVPLS